MQFDTASHSRGLFDFHFAALYESPLGSRASKGDAETCASKGEATAAAKALGKPMRDMGMAR